MFFRVRPWPMYMYCCVDFILKMILRSQKEDFDSFYSFALFFTSMLILYIYVIVIQSTAISEFFACEKLQ